jgi:hypothetical protein
MRPFVYVAGKAQRYTGDISAEMPELYDNFGKKIDDGASLPRLALEAYRETGKAAVRARKKQKQTQSNRTGNKAQAPRPSVNQANRPAAQN